MAVEEHFNRAMAKKVRFVSKKWFPSSNATNESVVCTTAMGCIQMDYVSGLPETQSGDIGLLAAVDYFTGFVVAWLVRALTADVSVHFLVNFIILQYGLPRTLQTDNSKHFARP